MDCRKVVESSGGVGFVSLPAAYRREMGIKKGDLLEVEWKDGVVSFFPLGHKSKLEESEAMQAAPDIFGEDEE